MDKKQRNHCRYQINSAFEKRILKEGVALRLHQMPNRGFVLARSAAPKGSPTFYDLNLEKTNASQKYRISYWVNSAKHACQEKYRREVGETWLPKGVAQVEIPNRERDRGYAIVFNLNNVTDADIDRRYDEVVDAIKQIKSKLFQCGLLNVTRTRSNT